MRITHLFHGVGKAVEEILDDFVNVTGAQARDARDDILRRARFGSLRTTIIAAVVGFALRHLIEYLL